MVPEDVPLPVLRGQLESAAHCGRPILIRARPPAPTG